MSSNGPFAQAISVPDPRLHRCASAVNPGPGFPSPQHFSHVCVMDCSVVGFPVYNINPLSSGISLIDLHSDWPRADICGINIVIFIKFCGVN